jgi:siroheme synthase-like protein
MKEFGTGSALEDLPKKQLIMKSEHLSSEIFLPISINITGKRVLIVGGGKVAAHKLSTLIKFTHDITVLAPDIIHEILNDSRLNCIIKPYEKDDLCDFHLVYACTNNRMVNAEIKKDANNLGLMVNVADDPELCDFISPAIYKQNHITVSVGSNARNVKKAIRIRNWIKEKLENGEIE